MLADLSRSFLNNILQATKAKLHAYWGKKKTEVCKSFYDDPLYINSISKFITLSQMVSRKRKNKKVRVSSNHSHRSSLASFGTTLFSSD